VKEEGVGQGTVRRCRPGLELAGGRNLAGQACKHFISEIQSRIHQLYCVDCIFGHVAASGVSCSREPRDDAIPQESSRVSSLVPS
jgi:hypothetical protein